MFKAVAAIAFSLLTLTGAAATEASLYIPYDIDVSITASVDQSPVEFMGDGIAAERAGLAASLEQSVALPEAETLAEIEADLATLEPTETGSLALMAWEEEEPLLVKAYFESRAAYEAMLTP